jgi:hypothetical protein
MPFVQVASGESNTTSLAVSFTNPVTAGNLLVYCLNKFPGADDTITDNRNTVVNDRAEIETTDNAAAVWRVANAAAGTTTVTATGGGSGARLLIIAEYDQIATVAPIDRTAGGSAFGATLTSGPTVATTQADELVIGFGACGNSAASPLTAGSGYTLRLSVASAQNKVNGLEDKIVSATGAQTATFTAASSSNYVCICVTYKIQVLVATLDQEGYRWRNDDGSETTATWKAAQDTTVTLNPSDVARLRVIVNATNDPASANYKLEYRKVGNASWKNIDTFN